MCPKKANYDGRQARMALYSGPSKLCDAITPRAQDIDMTVPLSLMHIFISAYLSLTIYIYCIVMFLVCDEFV